jgi:hypothetical protein
MPAEVLAGARDILGRNVTTTPEQLRRERVSDYESTVGAPSLDVFHRAAQELENRKKQLEGPKEGMPALMEYLQQIALAPKGIGSLTAGAMGAQKINEMKQAREQQQFDLNTKILDIEQKKIDSLRTYAKEKFNIGDTAFNQMFKANLDSARQVTQNDMDAEKLAAQKTEAELRRASEEKMAKERNETTLAAANAPGEIQKRANQILALRNSGKNEEADHLEALYSSLIGGGSAGVGAERNNIARIRLQINVAQNVLKDNRATPEQRAKAQADIAELQKQLTTAKAAAPSDSVLPPGTTTGKFVEGKGTEVFKDGKLIGYAN